MSFPRYPAYKDSGVEWLGEVPAHWNVSPLKHLVDLRSGGTPSKDRLDYWDGTVPWASAKDLKTERLQDTIDHITETALQAGAADLVPEGSVLVVVRGMILARDFPVSIAAVPMAINQDLKALTGRGSVTGLFLARLLAAAAGESSRLTDEAGHGTKALRMDTWTAMRLPIPSLDEQQAIVAFLDRETAKIDALVAEQQTLIDLLKEKRQAVISHAVTKGLDPNVPMKDSGVEWLGEVPAHWEVKRLKFVARVQTGVAKGKDYVDQPTIDVPYLRVANVQDGYLDLEDIASIRIPTNDVDRYLLRPGDVLMNEGGDFDKLGRGHVWDGSIAPCIHQNHVFAVRPFGVDPEWLNLVTGSAAAQFYFMSRSKQSTNLASISSTNVMELTLPVPPAVEAVSIVKDVARRMEAAGELIRQVETATDVLRERRAALISAAVTGQIDVRSSQPTNRHA